MSRGVHDPNEVGFYVLEILARAKPDGYAHPIGAVRVPITASDHFQPNKFVIELGPTLDKLRAVLEGE